MQNQKQSQNNQKQPAQENQPVISSPNLLNPQANNQSLVQKTHPTAIIFLKFLMVGLQGILIVFLLVNIKLDSDIQKLSADTLQLENYVEKNKSVEKEASDIIKRISYYKTLKQEQVKVSEGVDFLISSFPSELILRLVEFEDPKNFKLAAQANSPLAFAKLTNTLFKNSNIDEIILETAYFNKNENSFLIDFEVKYK